MISGQLNLILYCIDSKEPEIIEEALKNYAGKALINSVALDEKELKVKSFLLQKNMVLV